MGMVIGRGTGTPSATVVYIDSDFEDTGCTLDGWTPQNTPDCDDTTAPLLSATGAQQLLLSRGGTNTGNEIVDYASNFAATTHTYAAFCFRPEQFPNHVFSPLVFGFKDAVGGTTGYVRMDWSGGTTGVAGTLGCEGDASSTSWATAPLVIDDEYEIFIDFDANTDTVTASVYDGAGVQSTMGCTATSSTTVNDTANVQLKVENLLIAYFDEVRVQNAAFSVKPSGACTL